MKTVISIMIAEGAPKQAREEYKTEPLTKKVDKCIRKVESNQLDSAEEWEYLKKLYEKLSRKPKLSSEQEEILNKVEEVIEKYGSHDPKGSVDLDARFMNRGKNPEEGDC